MPRTSSVLTALDKQIEAAIAESQDCAARLNIQERLIASLQNARLDAAAAIRKRKAKTPPPTGATP